jgi:signal transduction histidine kinase
MAISLFFSINLYRVSTVEVRNRLQDQAQRIQRLPGGRGFLNDPDVVGLRDQQLVTAQHHLQLRLLWINLAILVVGGAGSYWLARRSLEPIEASHAAQSQFAGDASHELRTPLAVMQSEIEVALRDKRLSLEQAKQLLNSNLEELSKLTALSAGLLQLARNQNKGVKKAPVSSTEVIQFAAERVEAAARAKNIRLKLPDTNVKWLGDQTSLIELVSILIDNAVKYSPAGKSVTVTVSKSGMQVQDEGPGIPAEEQSRIFERFYRAKRQKASGHGLGLAIAQNIAKAHGGNITVLSKPGEGARFLVELPQ